MNAELLRAAIVEAKRFLAMAAEAERELKAPQPYCGNRCVAATKRASLDLTMALAALRRRP